MKGHRKMKYDIYLQTHELLCNEQLSRDAQFINEGFKISAFQIQAQTQTS